MTVSTLSHHQYRFNRQVDKCASEFKQAIEEQRPVTDDIHRKTTAILKRVLQTPSLAAPPCRYPLLLNAIKHYKEVRPKKETLATYYLYKTFGRCPTASLPSEEDLVDFMTAVVNGHHDAALERIKVLKEYPKQT